MDEHENETIDDHQVNLFGNWCERTWFGSHESHSCTIRFKFLHICWYSRLFSDYEWRPGGSKPSLKDSTIMSFNNESITILLSTNLQSIWYGHRSSTCISPSHGSSCRSMFTTLSRQVFIDERPWLSRTIGEKWHTSIFGNIDFNIRYSFRSRSTGENGTNRHSTMASIWLWWRRSRDSSSEESFRSYIHYFL